jgi:hypothetical protein
MDPKRQSLALVHGPVQAMISAPHPDSGLGREASLAVDGIANLGFGHSHPRVPRRCRTQGQAAIASAMAATEPSD